jgi:hypothetical protein
VGIPARACTVPLWRHTEGNHLWVEVYDRGKWRFIGAGEIESDYGLAWFEPALHTAPFLYSMAYGNSTAGIADKDVAHERLRSTLINRTAAYAPKGEVVISAEKGGEPVSDLHVALHTYNFASPGAFLLLRTDEGGKAGIELGTGVFLATASSGAGRDYAFFHVEAGRSTEVFLNLDRDRVFEGEAFMPFETDPDLRRLIQKTYEEARNEAGDRIDAVNEERRRAFEAAARAAVRAADPGSEDLARALEAAGMNAPEPARALMTVTKRTRPALERLLGGMVAKDLAACRAEGLIENAELAEAARRRLLENGVLKYDDEIFEKYVLPERILYEQFTHWRGALVERFGELRDAGGTDEIVEAVAEAVAALEPVGRGYFGPALPPEAVFSSGLRGGSGRDGRIAATAALRALGVPARAVRDRSWCEYFDGERWRPFHPWLDEPPKGVDTYYEPWAELWVAFTLDGEPVKPGSLQYGRDYMVGVYDERPGLNRLEAVKIGEKDGFVVIGLPAGECWLSSGRRDAGGRPYLRLERLILEPGEKSMLRRELGLPANPSIPEGTARPRPEGRSGPR